MPTPAPTELANILLPMSRLGWCWDGAGEEGVKSQAWTWPSWERRFSILRQVLSPLLGGSVEGTPEVRKTAWWGTQVSWHFLLLLWGLRPSQPLNTQSAGFSAQSVAGCCVHIAMTPTNSGTPHCWHRKFLLSCTEWEDWVWEKGKITF